MLVKNPVTRLLYEYGYNGNEDIYRYWTDNHKGLVEYIAGRIDKKQLSYSDLEVFELKVRWASHEGMWFRFQVKSLFRRDKAFSRFDEISFQSGPHRLRLKDFHDKTGLYIKPVERQDLRGISLLKVRFHDAYIEDVDFSYGAFDFSTFTNVVFINCKFDHTTFYRCRFLGCSFYDTCELDDNDFGRAMIDAKFDCPINNPQVIEPTWIEEKVYKVIGQAEYNEVLPLRFTWVRDASFTESMTRS